MALYVDDELCPGLKGFKVAYDLASHQQREFESVRLWLAKSIMDQYRVTPAELQFNGGNVFVWASAEEKTGARRAYWEFRKRVSD